MKLTDNFSLAEFNSKDGAEMPAGVLENIIKLAANIQIIRDEIGCALHVNSAYRSPAHNKAIGGVKNSQHLLGKASDLTSREHTPYQLYNIIKGLIADGKISKGGLGLYNSFVHYDIRGTNAQW